MSRTLIGRVFCRARILVRYIVGFGLDHIDQYEAYDISSSIRDFWPSHVKTVTFFLSRNIIGGDRGLCVFFSSLLGAISRLIIEDQTSPYSFQVILLDLLHIPSIWPARCTVQNRYTTCLLGHPGLMR